MPNLKKFFLNERGTTALLFGLLLIPLIGFLGLAIDSSRGYAVKHRLQESIDAAALAGARNFDAADRDAIIHHYFDVNWRNGFHITDTPIVTITADTQARTVSVTGKVNMETILMPAVGGTKVIEIGSVNTAYKDISFVELALALDTTTSMRLGTGANATVQPADPASRRINIMKEAATNFVNGLYTQNGVQQESMNNLRVSLVPFTSMVNVGKQHTNFLASGSLSGLTWDYPKESTPHDSWRGCVFERSFYSDLGNGGSYSGHDVDDVSPDVESFYPYNVPSPHLETLVICDAQVTTPSPPPPPSPPSSPPPPPPPPPNCTDGVCTTSLRGLPILSHLLRSEQVALRLSDMADQANPLESGLQKIALGTVNGVCEYGGQGPSWWSGYNQYQPAYQIESKTGIWVDAPSPDGTHTRSCFPHPSSPFRDNCSTPNRYSAFGPQSCCGGGYAGYNMTGWTYAGRWIAPWPASGTVKLGGWGNSGCGMPVIPLSNSRSSIVAAIQDLDVPLQRNSSLPDLGYSGTLINEGLVWAWRTISPNWRGYWKQGNGNAIESNLPKDYSDPGVSKAVVIMTDGVNYLPDRAAFVAGSTTSMFAQPSVFNNNTTTAVSFPHVTDNRLVNPTGPTEYKWDDVDSSAYGVLRGLFASTGQQSGSDRQIPFCDLRTLAASNSWGEPSLKTGRLGCRPYACMIRNAAGTCLSSAYNSWNPKLEDALVGPYYDELMNRLVKTCVNMRNNGVRVFFILFAINDNPQKTSTMAALNSCIGSTGKVYDAADATQLNSAFADILAQVRRLSLTH